MLCKKSPPDDYSREARQNPFLMSGTKVMNGFGKALVVVVGSCTMENRIREKLAEQSGPTPL